MNQDQLRRRFPSLQDNENIVYLDSAATTQKPDTVVNGMREYMNRLSVNPGRGGYDPAAQTEKEIELARKRVADFIHAQEAEIIYTSGATESLNMVAYSWGLNNLKDGDEVLLCKEDHSSTIRPWFNIQRILEKSGIRIKIKNYKHHQYLGNADIESIRNQLSERTRLIVATHIHNVHGTLSDIQAIRKVAGDERIIVLDACQSISHIPLDVQDLDVDFVAFSGHKMFALNGVGILFIKQKRHQEMAPFIVGGGSTMNREQGTGPPHFHISTLLESGTQNIAGIKSLSDSIRFIEDIGFEAIHAHTNELSRYLYQQLSGNDRIEFLAGYAFDKSRVGYGLLSFRVDGFRSADIGALLNQYHVYVRTGRHCIASSSSIDESIRVSLHVYNNEKDIDTLTKVLESIR